VGVEIRVGKHRFPVIVVAHDKGIHKDVFS
jgi:hypothetical protein